VRRIELLLAIVVVLLAGCGGGGGGTSAKDSGGTPTDQEITKIGPAQLDIPMQCLTPSGADETKLQSDVDTLIAVYKRRDPDAPFKLSPTGTSLTMRKVMTRSRDALQACAQAGVGGSAAQSLVDRINSVMDS
jgi:hypothetical protein